MKTIHSIGRRKASVARIYVTKGKGNFIINGKDFKEYLPLIKLLKDRSKEKHLGTLIMVSSFKNENLIRVNNNTTIEDKNKRRLLDEFLKIKNSNHNFNFTDLDEIFKNVPV